MKRYYFQENQNTGQTLRVRPAGEIGFRVNRRVWRFLKILFQECRAKRHSPHIRSEKCCLGWPSRKKTNPKWNKSTVIVTDGCAWMDCQARRISADQ